MVSEQEDTRNSSKRFQHRTSLTTAVSETLPPPVHFESLRVSDDQLKTYQNKKVREFYQVRNHKKKDRCCRIMQKKN